MGRGGLKYGFDVAMDVCMGVVIGGELQPWV